MRHLGFVLILFCSPLVYAQAQAQAQEQKPLPAAVKTTAPSSQQQNPAVKEAAPNKATPPPAETFEDRPTLNPSIEDEALNYKDAFMAFLKTILMLCVVLAFAYLLLGKGLPKLMSKTIQNSRMRIIERLPLDQKRSVFLVEVDKTTYLLGGSDQNLQLIDTLKQEAPDFQSKLDVKKASALKEVS